MSGEQTHGGLDAVGGVDAEEGKAVAEDFRGEVAEADAAFADAGFGLEEGDVLVERRIGLREVVEGVGEERGLFLVGGVADGVGVAREA